MPLVRMLTSVAGPTVQWHEGDEVQMSPEDAAVWADGVRGELVRGIRPVAPEQRRRGVETPEG
jgi:hypothetical protein